MLGHYPQLRAVPASLTSLHIHTVGKARGDLSDVLDEEHWRYQGIGDFIGSCARTLEKLVFEQGMTAWDIGRRDGSRSCRRYTPPLDWSRRPMDKLFSTHILTKILTSNWPRLRRLELRGIGGTRPALLGGYIPANTHSAPTVTTLNELESFIHSIIGANVTIILTQSVERAYGFGKATNSTGLENLRSGKGGFK